jgi:hypothetical protein
MAEFPTKAKVVIIRLIAPPGETYGLSMRPAGVVKDLDIHADRVAKVVGGND